ncbi:protein UNUSUAL FLORAL ORGANS [Silene latifolia]|uniref:protein UNUSUAL FLORAL ORGANS n=1 Tax=Silene latifolia TaxID=37657 RepID=UPI003D7873E9
METFSPSSINLPFPYNSYTLPNVTVFTPPPFTTNVTTITTTTMETPTTTPWMDSRIWSRIPQQLMDRILACLPPPAFFRARSVCKRWYALLFSNTFLQLYLQVCPNFHWFIFFPHKKPNTNMNIYRNNPNTEDHNGGSCSPNSTQAYLFDPYEVKWHVISFPLIPLGFSPSASSGGLICWISDEPGPKNLFLHNPLVGSLTQLPPTLRPRLFPSIGLSITPNSILMTLAGDDLISPYAVKNLTTETFHVDSSGFYSIWATNSTLPRLCSLESAQMVHSHGRFYCMDYNPFSVLTYDLSTNTWWKIQAPMRRFLRSPSLVQCTHGKILLVAAVEKSKLNVPRSLRLWVLQGCGTQWVEVERMPQQLYAQFEEVEGGRGFDCVGNGEFIIIMIKGINKGLLFDFEKKRWIWMPNYSANNDVSCVISDLHGFAYQPTLAVPVSALVQQLFRLEN